MTEPTDRELIEALLEPGPLRESPMGYDYCAWCDADITYRPIEHDKYRHQWTCAWMRATTHLGLPVPAGHGWGERPWNTAYVRRPDQKPGSLPPLYGDIPQAGDRIAFVWMEMVSVISAGFGVVTGLNDHGLPILLLDNNDDGPAINFEPAHREIGLGAIPMFVWTDLNLTDPRVPA